MAVFADGVLTLRWVLEPVVCRLSLYPCPRAAGAARGVGPAEVAPGLDAEGEISQDLALNGH